MPNRDEYEAAHPRCPQRIGSPLPSLQRDCLTPMFTDPASEQWVCPKCGPAMTWTKAAQRLRAAAGALYYDEDAA